MAPTVLFQARTSVRLNEWYIGYSSVFGLRERDTFFRTASLRCPFSSGIGLTETFGANAFSQSVRPRTLETLMIVLSDEPLSPSRFFSAPTLIDARAASSVCSRLALQSWNRRASWYAFPKFSSPEELGGFSLELKTKMCYIGSVVL